MTNMPDEIILLWIMTVLDLEFERTHYHDKGYGSDGDNDLPDPLMRLVHIYLVSMTEAYLNLAD